MKNNRPTGVLERRSDAVRFSRLGESGAKPFASFRRPEKKAFGSTQKEYEIKYLVDYIDLDSSTGWRIESGMTATIINQLLANSLYATVQ